MKRQRWWNTPNYYLGHFTKYLVLISGLVFGFGILHVGFLFLFLDGPAPTITEWVLTYACSCYITLAIFLVHRYEFVMHLKKTKQLTEEG